HHRGRRTARARAEPKRCANRGRPGAQSMPLRYARPDSTRDPRGRARDAEADHLSFAELTEIHQSSALTPSPSPAGPSPLSPLPQGEGNSVRTCGAVIRTEGSIVTEMVVGHFREAWSP